MRSIIRYFAAVILCMTVVQVRAQETDTDTPIPIADKWERWGPTSRTGFGFQLKMGYSIGGYSPLPIPREIRKIQKFSPQGGISVGIEGYKMFNRRWGLKIGVTLANQGFSTKAEVKNYYTKMKLEGDEQQGWFTGTNETSINNWTLTIPVLATFRMSPRWHVSLGPYLQVFLSKNFEATVYGFKDDPDRVSGLRIDEGYGPTGEYIDFRPSWDEEKKKWDYSEAYSDLSKDMVTCTAGIELLFDWKITKHIGAFGKLDWGFTSIFPGDYDTVRFKMFPIFGTIGGAYCF